MHVVRPPAVAGLFYPGQPELLRLAVDALIDGAQTSAAPAGVLKLLIVPHAGYVYSGAVAAAAYALLKAQQRAIRRVVLLGPTHRVAVRGVAVPDVDAFATPLGTIAIDREEVARLARLPFIVTSEAAHAAEHSLEVQLPFLQTVLRDFTLVPFAVGNVADSDVATLIEAAWGDDATLVVISSDLSHYRSYREAQSFDRATIARILSLHAGLDHEQACGATPINAALAVARKAGLRPRVLAQCNSGDSAGDRTRVVGYCAIAFERENDATH